MGGGKGGSADQSGMFEALISAQAAQQSYQLGQDQLAWTKQVWNQEQPMIQQVVSSDVAAQQQQTQFASEQEQLYQQTYQPLEQQYAQQAEQWASPQQQQINAAAAMGNVNEAAESQRQSSQEQLESYGINPGSTRFAGLDIGSRTMQAAASAGAGTQASQATLLQGLGLEAGVVNTGRGLPNTTASLTTSGVGAGSAAAGASQSNLATGSSAMTAPSNWYNTGAANMNTYVNAVNGYNQAQLGYAQVGAMQSMGMGSLAGSVLGLLRRGGPVLHFDQGGLVFQDGGDVGSRPIWQSPQSVSGAPQYYEPDEMMTKMASRQWNPQGQNTPGRPEPANTNQSIYSQMDNKELGEYHTNAALHHINVQMDYDRLQKMKTDPSTKNYEEAVVRQNGLDNEIANHQSVITYGNSDLNEQRTQLQARGLESPFAKQWSRLTRPVGAQVYGGYGLPEQPTAIPKPANINEPMSGGNPMSPLARPMAVGLQHIQNPGMMQQPPEMGVMPRELTGSQPISEQQGGPIPRNQGNVTGTPGVNWSTRYQDGGDTDQNTYTPPAAPVPQPQTAIPAGGTPGGGVPDEASPSGGQAVDDVPARLTAGEFVVPKDVAQWKGHEYFVKQIDQARNAQEQFRQRGDIGGERGTAIPQQPTFISRPVQQGMRTGSTGVAQHAIPPQPPQ